MIIKNVDNTTILDADINENSIYHHSLMNNEYVRLNFSTSISRYISFPAGAYVEYKGEKYTLIEPYTPERKDESEIYYELTFHSPRQMWKKMVLFYEQDGVRETDFNTTDYIYNIGVIIVNNLLWSTGIQYTFSYDSSLVGTNSFSFREVSIFDALTQLANAWDTEWWVEGAIIHLSKCKHSDMVALRVGENISPATITKPNDGYFTRFYIFGSTRNILQDDSSSNTVTTLLNRRLRLPDTTYPGSYIDIRSNLSQNEIFSTVLYFDDIYPSSPYTIKDAGTKIVGEDENLGLEGVIQWWFTLNEVTTFDRSLIIPGKTLSVSFTSGALFGWEFELQFNLKNDVPEEHEGRTKFYITPDISTGMTVPGLAVMNLGSGDNVILFNLVMPDDYVVAARKKLEEAAIAEIERRKLNMNEYRFDSDPVFFNNNNINLNVGNYVRYRDDITELYTRVLTVEKQLDYEIQQSITIGEKKISSSNQELRSEVNTIVENVNNFIDFKTLSSNINNAINIATQQAIQAIVSMGSLWVAVPNIQNIQYLHTTHKVVIDGDLVVKGNILSQKEITAWVDNGGGGGTGGSGLIQKVYSYSDLGGVFSNATLTDTFNAYTTNELYKRIVLLESGSGISGNFVRSVTANGYPGLAHTDGTTTNYFRTTSSGLIPYASGGSSYLGTTTWPFLHINGVNVNGTTLSVSGVSTLTGNVYGKSALYSYGKTAYNDGKDGVYINDGVVSLAHTTNPRIAFHFGGSTSTTSYIREYASGRLGVTGSLHVGGATQTSYQLQVTGTSNFSSLASFSSNVWVLGNLGIGSENSAYKLNVSGKGNFTGTIYARDYIFTDNKTSSGDGVTGNVVGGGNLWLCATGSVGIHFYGSSSTSTTNQLIDYSGQIRVANKFQVGSLSSLTSVYTFYVNGTSFLSGQLNTGSGIYTHGKTSTTDGKSGHILSDGNYYIESATNPCIYFYRYNATSVTGSIMNNSSNQFVVQGNWLPTTTAAYTIGSDSYRWNYGYFVNINISGTSTFTGRVSLNGGANVQYTNTSYALSTASFICNDWVRTVGNTGWYNQTYGGGIHMTDTTYVRVYNDKRFYVSNTLSPTNTDAGNAAISTIGGINCLRAIYAGGNIVSYGEVTAWSTSSSDIRLKKNIKEFNAIDIIEKLNYFSFDWNKKALSINSCFNNDYKHYGASAQDVEKILPGFVGKINGYKTVSYERFIPIIMQGIKELKRENDKLKKELKLLRDGYTTGQ